MYGSRVAGHDGRLARLVDVGGQRVENLLTLELDRDPAPHPGHRFGGASLTRRFGAATTGLGVYELEPGNAGWPYHFEVNEEEWLIVVAGEVTLRTPDGEFVLRTGDAVCFPAGAAGAHAVRNHTDASARFVIPSTNARFGGTAVYPDSGKMSIRTRGFEHRGRLGEPVEYWEGEP